MMIDTLQMQQRFPQPPKSVTTTWSAIGVAAALDIQPAADPATFDSAADVIQWANRTGADSARSTAFGYKGRKLLVVFRSRTWGRYSSEPFVFAERSGKWVCLLCAATCYFHMEASVECDSLVIWRLKGPGDKAKTEFLRYSLTELDAGPALPTTPSGKAAVLPAR